jgi:hypothetical protein
MNVLISKLLILFFACAAFEDPSGNKSETSKASREKATQFIKESLAGIDNPNGAGYSKGVIKSHGSNNPQRDGVNGAGIAPQFPRAGLALESPFDKLRERNVQASECRERCKSDSECLTRCINNPARMKPDGQ